MVEGLHDSNVLGCPFSYTGRIFTWPRTFKHVISRGMCPTLQYEDRFAYLQQNRI